MYDLRKPCPECPFLREGGVRLTLGRVREIAGGMLHSQGHTFHCHKTIGHDEDGDGVMTAKSQHCAGALIFAEKQGTSTQMMRIAERLGMYNAAALMADEAVVDSVFDDLEEMLATNRLNWKRK